MYVTNVHEEGVPYPSCEIHNKYKDYRVVNCDLAWFICNKTRESVFICVYICSVCQGWDFQLLLSQTMGTSHVRNLTLLFCYLKGLVNLLETFT